MGERLESLQVQPIQEAWSLDKVGKALTAGLLVAGGVIGFANRSAAAESIDNHSAATVIDYSHGDTNPYNVNITVDGSSFSATEVINHSVTILSDNQHVKGYNSVNPGSCVWEKNFWDSGEAANGKLFWFKDRKGELCRDANSPTDWVKVAGGESGRDCGNIAKPMGYVPGPLAPGKVELVANFNTAATLSAEATATATAQCSGPAGSAESSASASATAEDTVKLEAFLRENASQQTNLEARLYSNANLKAEASAKASAQAACVTYTPTPTPQPTPTPTPQPTPTPSFEPVYVQILNQGMEPVNAGSQIQVCETVSGGNPGDNISLSASVNDGSISSPQYNQAVGAYCETWNTPISPTTDAEITVSASDLTEQSQGAPSGDYLSTAYTNVAVMQQQ